MRGAVIDSFHSGCGNRNGNRHRTWRCHGATLCGPADTVALRRTAEDPAGAAGLTVSSCAGCRWAAACVPAGLSPGNRRSISAAAAISPDRSKAARTLAASASSLLPWRTSAKHGRHAAGGASGGFPDALYPGPCPATGLPGLAGRRRVHTARGRAAPAAASLSRLDGELEKPADGARVRHVHDACGTVTRHIRDS